jgi:hypothetical protein
MKTSTILAMALALGSSAFAQKVNVEYAHKVDFSKFSTYRWAKNKGQLPDADEDRHIKTKVDSVLQAKGLHLVDSRMADMVLTYQATMKNEQQVDSYSDDDDLGMGGGWGWGPGWGMGWGDMGPSYSNSTIKTVHTGDLLVDISDPMNKRMLFRAYSSGAFHSDPIKEDKLLSKTVEKMLKGFPPKTK